MSKDKNHIKKANTAQKLREIINNTEENIEDAEISKEFADAEQIKNLEEHNSNRRQSIAQFKEQLKEIQDNKGKTL